MRARDRDHPEDGFEGAASLHEQILEEAASRSRPAYLDVVLRRRPERCAATEEDRRDPGESPPDGGISPQPASDSL